VRIQDEQAARIDSLCQATGRSTLVRALTLAGGAGICTRLIDELALVRDAHRSD